MTTQIMGGILIPFVGTSLGAAMVFFLKKHISENLQKVLTGFAAGVMVAASFWSLLQPALESSEGLGKLSFQRRWAFSSASGSCSCWTWSRPTCTWTGRRKGRKVD